MKVIVIAAGKGKRISNEFKEIPKALIPINGKTIFEKQKYVINKIKRILDYAKIKKRTKK